MVGIYRSIKITSSTELFKNYNYYFLGITWNVREDKPKWILKVVLLFFLSWATYRASLQNIILKEMPMLKANLKAHTYKRWLKRIFGRWFIKLSRNMPLANFETNNIHLKEKKENKSVFYVLHMEEIRTPCYFLLQCLNTIFYIY